MIDQSIVNAILTSAGAGTAIIVILILAGLLQTKSFVERVEREADDWKAAYEAERAARETERRANDELRAANRAQTQRADAAVETAAMARELFADLQRRISAPTVPPP